MTYTEHWRDEALTALREKGIVRYSVIGRVSSGEFRVLRESDDPSVVAISEVEEALASNGWRTFREHNCRTRLKAIPPASPAAHEVARLLRPAPMCLWDNYGRVSRAGLVVIEAHVSEEDEPPSGARIWWRPADHMIEGGMRRPEAEVFADNRAALDSARETLTGAGWTVDHHRAAYQDAYLIAAPPKVQEPTEILEASR